MFCKIQSVHISGHMNKYMSLLELLLRVPTVTAVQHFRDQRAAIFVLRRSDLGALWNA